MPKESAVIGLSNEKAMPLEGDHRSIAQMANSGAGRLVFQSICELVARTARSVGESHRYWTRLFTIC